MLLLCPLSSRDLFLQSLRFGQVSKSLDCPVQLQSSKHVKHTYTYRSFVHSLLNSSIRIFLLVELHQWKDLANWVSQNARTPVPQNFEGHHPQKIPLVLIHHQLPSFGIFGDESHWKRWMGRLSWGLHRHSITIWVIYICESKPPLSLPKC